MWLQLLSSLSPPSSFTPFLCERAELELEVSVTIPENQRKGMMSAIILSPCNSNLIYPSPFHPRLFRSVGLRIQTQIISRTNLRYQNKTLPRRFSAVAVSKGSAKPSESEKTMPSWAKPDSEEPPPWASDEDKDFASPQSLEIPFYVYLLASSITAIAAIGSIFEYVNQRPVFGILNSDSVFYAPLLGFFAFTGIPTSAYLWLKSVQVANKEAEEQDRRDGFL